MVFIPNGWMSLPGQANLIPDTPEIQFICILNSLSGERNRRPLVPNKQKLMQPAKKTR